MATVRLSDIIDITVFDDLPPVDNPERTGFFQSGVVVRNELLDSLADQPGKVAELPFWNDIDPEDAPNLSSDDPGSDATPKKINQGAQISRKAFLNQGWSEMDLAAELAMGGRAMEHIRGRTDTYWTRQWQRRLIRSALGVMEDSLANHSGDMVEESTDPFSKTSFVKAAGTMGDRRENLGAIAVHSSVRDQMEFNDLIEFIRDSEGNLIGEAFSGMQLIVDDGLPVIDASPDLDYISIIFGAGAFGWGEGMPAVPTAVDRKEEAGDGGGQETLWSRRTFLLHPFGYRAVAEPAGNSYSLAELEAAATWTRVIPRKAIPLAFLRTRNDGQNASS